MAKADTLTFSRRVKDLIGMEINFILQIFRCYSKHLLVLFVFHLETCDFDGGFVALASVSHL